MLREYRLTNFKAFGETVTIPIRPLTLIFGANSSGKSSIFQSMLLLKQTLEEAKNPNTALLPKGSLVDLGTYSDFVHRHETDRNFEFGAYFDLEGTDALPPLVREVIEGACVTNTELTVQFSSEEKRPLRLDLATGDQKQAIISYHPARRYRQSEIEARIATLRDEQGDLIKRIVALATENKKEEVKAVGPELVRVGEQLRHNSKLLEEVEVKPDSEIWRRWWECTKSYIREELDKDEVWLYGGNEKDEFFEKLEDYQFEDALKDIGNASNSSTIVYKNFLPKSHNRKYIGGPFQVSYFYSSYPEDEYIDGLDISPFTLHVCSTFRRLFEDLVYLGPLRRHPERYYEFSGDTTDYVGQSGEYLPSILFEGQELVEQANSDLERLGVKYQVKLDKLQYEDKSPSNVFSLRLVDTETGIDASLRDVGFGISQVLPIVVQSGLSEKKTLLIEQPEIHLHPAHQAELGDMFIRSALEQKNTLLLETHSENLILRILRRIRETNDNELPEGFPPIRPEDVAILYVQPGEKGAQVIEIPVTEDGDFARPWPQGFFDERVQELF